MCGGASKLTTEETKCIWDHNWALEVVILFCSGHLAFHNPQPELPLQPGACGQQAHSRSLMKTEKHFSDLRAGRGLRKNHLSSSFYLHIYKPAPSHWPGEAEVEEWGKNRFPEPSARDSSSRPSVSPYKGRERTGNGLGSVTYLVFSACLWLSFLQTVNISEWKLWVQWFHLWFLLPWALLLRVPPPPQPSSSFPGILLHLSTGQL